MSRRTRVISIVVLALVVIGIWLGWVLYQGPTATRELKSGDVVSLVSHLGTATVPPKWTGRVVDVRTDPISRLRFGLDRSMSRQVIGVRSPDGLVTVKLDVVHGPKEYRAQQSAAVALARANKYGFSPVMSVPASSEDSDYGGRARMVVGDAAPPGVVRQSVFTVFVWDRSTPFVITQTEPELPSGPPGSSASAAQAREGIGAFEFTRASK